MSPVHLERLQIAYFVGLVTCVAGALLGQAELVGEPWRHWLSIASIVGTAVNGYLLQPARGTSRTREDDPPDTTDRP